MSHAADVFFSHNAQDKELLKPLAARLIDEYDIHCWLDQWELPAGKAWEREITSAMETCQSSAVFLGASGWGEYHLREAKFVIDRAKTQSDFVAIPVLLPGAIAGDMAKAGDFFESVHRVDFRTGFDDETAFQSLRAAIRRDPVGPPALTIFTIRRDAQRWSARPARDVSVLYRGAQLQHAQELVGEHAEAVDPLSLRFLTASAAEERRVIEVERRRNRVVTAILSTLVIALAVAGLVALLAKWDADDQSYLAKGQAIIADIKSGTAERRRIEKEQQMQRAFAFNLAEQGRRNYEDQPLLGARLVVEALQYSTDLDPTVRQRALESLVTMKRRARVMKIGTNLSMPLFIEDTPYYVENRAGERSELRRIRDHSLVTVLPDVATEIESLASIGLFRINYQQHVSELRRVAGATTVSLSGPLEYVSFTNVSDRYFVVRYMDRPAELWCHDPLSRRAVLSAQDPWIAAIEGSAVFFVGYMNAHPAELRRNDTGALVETLTLHCQLEGVSGDRSVFAVKRNVEHEDDIVEIRRTSDGKLVPSAKPITAVRFDERSGRYLVIFAGGGGEIRDSGSSAVPIAGRVIAAGFLSSTVIVAYADRNGEVRSADASKVLSTLPFPVRGIHEHRPSAVVELSTGEYESRLYWPATDTLSPETLPSPFEQRFARTRFGVLDRKTGELLPEGTAAAVGPYAVLKLADGSAELRRKDTGKRIRLGSIEWPGRFDEVHSEGDPAPFLYLGKVIIDEHTDRATPLPAHPQYAGYSDDKRYAVIGYPDQKAELRRADGRLIAKLSGRMVSAEYTVQFSRDGSVFFIEYEDAPSEVRVSATGQILLRTQKVTFTPGRKVMLVAKDSQSAEIRPEGYDGYPILPVDQLPAAVGADSEARRILAWYENGQAFLLDYSWHHAAESLAELQRETCRLFEPALLEQAAVSPYLLGNRPRACGAALMTSSAP